MWILLGEEVTATKVHVQSQFTELGYADLQEKKHPIIGSLIEITMPEFEVQEGMEGTLYYNPTTRKAFNEYTPRQLTTEELNKQRMANLEVAIANILGV